MKILLKEINKKRFLVSVPFLIAKFQAKILQLLPKPLLTTDQVEMLKYDNIVTNKYIEMDMFLPRKQGRYLPEELIEQQ